MQKQYWIISTLMNLFAVIGMGVSVAQEAAEEPSPEETEASEAFEKAALQIKADINRELKAVKLDQSRKNRITQMAVAAYQMNGNTPLWGNVEDQEIADSDIQELLDFNGISTELRVPSFTLTEVYLNENSPVAKNDLRATLRLAEACLLLKEGPYNLNIGWGEDWFNDDFAGEGDVDDQKRRLSHNFANMVAKQPDSQLGIALSYVPQNWIYRRFIEQLVLTKSSAEPPQLEVTTFLRAGNDFDQAKDLALYLQEEGHLDEDGLEDVLSQPEGKYTTALAEGVKSYQKSKGLMQDGIIGPATAHRISKNNDIEKSQLLLNLHRARFMPNNPGERHVLINLPSSRVYGIEKNKVTADLEVAFGRNQDGYRTPIFRDRMEFVVFQPGKTSESEEAINLSKQYFSTSTKGGNWRPSGTVSFLFPNNHSVFFDDSAASSSTGSLQVLKPDVMASWVLKDLDWSGYDVQKAMKSGRNQWVKLKQPISVYIVYFTVFPKTDQHSGVNFHLDHYNRDKLGQNAL